MRILLISTADWDHPFWTNKQHVTMALAGLGHEVLYVESLGIRPFSRSAVNDTGRVVGRLRKMFRRPREVDKRITVVSPLVLPLWGHKWAVLINRCVMAIQLAVWQRSWGKWDIVWTYSPVTSAALVLKNDLIVYHCVDNISVQPTMPTEAIDRYEASLVRRSDLVFTTAPELTTRVRAMGASNIHEHTNVVDYDHFDTASQYTRTDRQRRVGFVGALSGYKIDLALLVKVANSFPQCELVLIGQVGEGEPGASVDVLRKLPNVTLKGPQSYAGLPGELANMDVAILPVPLNEYTQSMFPMKFFEYLAAGLPVVATDIPSLRSFSDFAFIARSHDEFIEKVSVALNSSADWRKRGKELASRYTYKQRTMDMLAEVQALGPIDGARR